MTEPGPHLPAQDQDKPREVRRPKHLMDPANPVRPVNNHALTNVQRWVMSVLLVFTVAHLAVGLVIAAVMIDPEQQVPRIGLSVIAGAFGMLGLAGGFLVHRRSPFTPWLALGLVPTLVGLFLILR